jgi:hypothetical protein
MEMISDLATALPHRAVSGDEAISVALRELVSCVTVTPAADGEPPRISVTGRLAVLVGGDLFPHSRGDIGGSGGALPSISPRPIPLEMAYLFDVA